MKNTTGIILKVLLGFILLILVLLFTLPVIFKEQIRTKVEQTINESVNATVSFNDYKLGFFRNFPNLSFSLNDVSVVGVDKFKDDTLAGFQSFDLVFNLSSIFKKSGYEVKSIRIDKAVINAIVLKDGSANWDIMKADTTETTIPAPETASTSASSSSMKILLKKVSMENSSISYVDKSAAMVAYLKNIRFNLSGDMTMSQTDLKILFTIGDMTFIMDGTKYLNRSVVDSKFDLIANLDKMKFTFGENYLKLNDLILNFSGSVAMPGDDIETDLKFGAPETSFKTLLSLVPAIYMADYKDLKTSGTFSMSGSAKGVYSDADSTLPDISLDLSVSNGLISYPDLPEQIKNININSNVFVNGKDLDKTLLNIDRFHLELAGSPFDMSFALKTPISDPDFKGSASGRVDLTALSKAVPMDSISLSGIIEMSMQMAGRMSMLEKEQYEEFKASGTMSIKNMEVDMIGYPAVKITQAGFTFTPAYAEMSNTMLVVGSKSDFTLNGKLENYIPYAFHGQAIKGNLSMGSKLTDVSDIMSGMASDTTITTEDTTALSLMQVPRNIDFDFNALIDDFSYDNIRANKVKGHIIVHDGILSIKDAGMNILGGTLAMDADYDTRDTLKPVMKADLNMRNIAIKDAFNTFNTVQKLAPAAKGIDGIVNARLNYVSLLGRDMMPVLNTINGYGKVSSDQITLVESATFDKMKDLLKLGDKYSNTFKDINISFKISDGRIYVSPFDIKTGNLKMNISGDQGLDQSINYIVKTQFPRSDLGSSVNSLIDNLSAQAANFGINYKPSETIKVNVKVTGSFSKPVVVPYFGSGTSSGTRTPKESAKEAVKQTIDNTVDKAKEKARTEAEEQGVKLIREAEEKGQQLRDQAATTAEQMRSEAAKQAKKLNDDAASKGTIAKMAAKKTGDALIKTADQKADQVIQEADKQAKKLVEEAQAKSDELIKKI